MPGFSILEYQLVHAVLVVFEFILHYIKVEVCDSNTKQSKCSNCTVNPIKYLEEKSEDTLPSPPSSTTTHHY